MASDITIASTPCGSSSSNWNLSISSSSEEDDAIPSSAISIPRVLAELVGQLKEHPVGLDDQLAEGRVTPKNEVETRLYELIGSRLP